MPKLNHVDPPKDERSSGDVKFNYASYDGRFVIGKDPWAFETRWSGAASGEAHLYNDPAGIEGVAIVETVTSIAQVTPELVAAADFTSRARTLTVGQVALLLNSGGFYAAVEPLDIGYSSSPSGNMMLLRFAIQTDHSTDFSMFASVFDDRQALIGQLLAAVADAERLLARLSIKETGEIGIGHNRPPADAALTEDDRVEALKAIKVVRQEAMGTSPTNSSLYAAGQVLARVAGKIAMWVGQKADVAAAEFAKALGKAAGVAIVGLGLDVWIDLQSKLIEIVDILRSFTS